MKKLCLVLVALILSAASARAVDTVVLTTNNQISCPAPKGGSSTTKIALTEWNWGSSFPVAGSGVGVLNITQVSIGKEFDQCTTPMLSAYLAGTRLGTVLIEQERTVSSTTAPLAEVTLTNAYFASYGLGGSTSGPPSEQWTLAFDKICVTFYKLNANGTTTAGTPVCYGN